MVLRHARGAHNRARTAAASASGSAMG
jgi:hypothetical protein